MTCSYNCSECSFMEYVETHDHNILPLCIEAFLNRVQKGKLHESTQTSYARAHYRAELGGCNRNSYFPDYFYSDLSLFADYDTIHSREEIQRFKNLMLEMTNQYYELKTMPPLPERNIFKKLFKRLSNKIKD